MEPVELKQRTKQFALRIIRMVEALPKPGTSGILGKQPLRNGTFVGANDRAACRATSRADFVSKMGTVEEECEDTSCWMELRAENGQVKPSRLSALMKEGDGVLRIVAGSSRKARRNSNPQYR
jgi:four helix bundle protein